MISQAYAVEHARWPDPSYNVAPLVGVQVKLQSFTTDDADRIRHAGFDFVRIGVWTDRMNQPAYRRALDQAIASAHASQLSVLLTVRALNPFIAPEMPTGARKDALGAAGGEMANFVNHIADQYGSKLLAIELWNEPDLHKYWPTGDVDETFVPFMKAICDRLHTHRPAVPVIGFAFSRAPLDGSIPDRLLQPLAKSLPGCIDAISYHAYGMTPEQIRSTARAMRARYDLPVAISEYGATASGFISADGQAKRLTALLDNLNDLATPLVSVYEWADTPNGPDAAQRNYGLVRADRTAKPALDVVERALRDARARRPDGASKASDTGD